MSRIVAIAREAIKRSPALSGLLLGARRSPHWSLVEHTWRSDHSRCACWPACQGSENLQVHHIVPFHDKPELELADGTGRWCQARNQDGTFVCNLITLCEGPAEHHIHIGHGGSFKTFNPHVLVDAQEMYEHPENAQMILMRARAAALPNVPDE